MCRTVEAMSDLELLGLVVGDKTAMLMLENAGGSMAALWSESLPACGPKARCNVKLKAAKELVRRSLFEDLRHGNALTSPGAVRDFLRATLARRDYEVFMVLFMDTQHRVIESEELFRGTLTQTSVYPREVVKRSLFNNAAAVIFAHNHPSGVAQPSQADEMLTRQLREALALVDIRVLDHFIVAGNQTLSFAERGLI